MLNKKMTVAILCAFMIFLLCGCTEMVELAGEKLPADSTELTMVLKAGDMVNLDQFPSLTYLDLSGSEDYEEIHRWAQAHPQVEVRYTLSFPEGTVAAHDTVSLDLSGLAQSDVEAAAELLGYLTELEELVLMPGEFSPQQVARLSEAAGVDIEYSYPLCGQNVDLYAESVDLSMLGDADVPAALELLPILPRLSHVQLGTQQEGRLSRDSVYALVQACPEVDFDYAFSIYGKSFSLADREIDLNHMPLGDNGAQVYQAARCMRDLEYLDMDFCGVPNEIMEQIRDGLPGVKVVWRIWFGNAYSVRTDTEKILASKPSAGGFLNDQAAQVLKYCTDVKYLDLGHNLYLTDISFVSHMPKLEALVLAMNDIADISPLANCPELEYLELQTNQRLGDISPLANCKKLAHLNLVQCRNVADISPLFGLEKLERFWLGNGNMVTPEQKEQFVGLFPDCIFNDYAFSDPTTDGWRVTDIDIITWIPTYAPRYELLMEQFGYAEEDYSFYWKDPKYNAAQG